MIGERFHTWTDFASSIAIVAASVALLSSAGERFFQGSARSGRAAAPAQVEAIDVRINRSAITKSLGRGRVAIAEFSDFECPFCGMFARSTFPQIKNELIDSGVVEFVYFHFPLSAIHPLALDASRAGECAAAQGRFWEMRQLLFREDDSLESARLVARAEELRLDVARFRVCMATPGDTQVSDDIEVGRQLGIDATPALLIGLVDADGSLVLTKKIRGSAPYRQIKDAVDAVSLRPGA